MVHGFAAEKRSDPCRLKIREVLSPYCQHHKGVTVERLDRYDQEKNAG